MSAHKLEGGRMKVNIELDLTPEEARTLMGLPDVTKLNEAVIGEMQKRMTAALDVSDLEAMAKAWMPFGGFEQFQRFLWDRAKPGGKKDQPDR
jgi:Family of unknown function (DUF6489)